MSLKMITAAVCTYNRWDSLKDTLASLQAQRLEPGTAMEIVVVDNNSRDRTKDVVLEAAAAGPHPVRYVLEPHQGIGHARNRALREAKGEHLAFIDDDAVASPEWLQALLRCFRDSGADMVGGKVEPLWEAERPAWLTDDLLGPIMMMDLGSARRRIDAAREFFLTTNCAVRRSALARFGEFDASLGRRGDRWIGGEDNEWCQRWDRHGAALMYEPSAVVYHKVSPDRVTPAFFRRWYEDIGYTQAHQLPWQWHYAASVLPAWRWAKLAAAWAGNWRARITGSEAQQLRAEYWWIFQRSFARERWDHWKAKVNGKGHGLRCRFARA
jgi:glucosyl-dolichyl phosphate glucuronosyltransferase